MNKIHFSLIILFWFLGIHLSNAQNNSSLEKVEAARHQFIEKRLALTPEQELKFWPVYNDYIDQKKTIKKNIRKLKIEEFANADTDEELKLDIERLIELRQQELDLDKSYYKKFLKILSPRQTADLIRAEREFIRLLYKIIED